jgi:hypothetical protein
MQALAAFIQIIVCGWIPQWSQYPTWQHWSHSLFNLAPGKVYRFVRGLFYGGKGRSGRVNNTLDPLDVCFPTPDPSTVEEWNLPGVYESTTHYGIVAAMIMLSHSDKNVPKIHGDRACAIPVVTAFDERALNLGAFEKTHLDADGIPISRLYGFAQPWDFEKCNELWESQGLEGTKATLNSEPYLESVIEFHTIGLSEPAVKLNTGTAYVSGAGTAVEIMERVKEYQHASEVCLCCIQKGPEAINTCQKEFVGACCSNCEGDSSITDANPCVYLASVYSFSDMGGGQVKAMAQLNAEAREAADSPMRRYGHPVLHFVKAMTGAMRNYRLTDGTDEFCILFLIAVYCSNTPEAKLLSTLVSKAVFDFKDRHSDRLCFETHCTAVRDLWAGMGHVKATIIPEQYRLFAPQAANHEHILDRPTFVAVTTKGDVLISDAEKHVVILCSRNNPTKAKVICGTVDQPGSASAGVGINTCMRFPSGLAITPFKAGMQDCLVADTKNRCIRVIEHVESIDKVQSTRFLSLGELEYLPYGLALVDRNTLAVSGIDDMKVHLYQLDDVAYAGGPIMCLSGFAQPGGMVFHSQLNKLLVADGKRVLQVCV